MNIASEKSSARQSAFERRAKAHGAMTVDIIAPVLELTKLHKIIAAYMPMRTEIDPLPAMHALHDAGKTICIPVIVKKDAPLIFCQWLPDMEMVEGAFGALIPAIQKPMIPDFVIAPLVSFDDMGTRLGYGGGFYDRTVEELRMKRPTPYVGLAYQVQKSESILPKEETDIMLDAIITEKAVENFRT